MNKFFIITFILINIATHATDFDVIATKKLADITNEETELNPEVLENLELNNYIAPNERNPNFYANFLKDKTGTLLSVGTFRALIMFTIGKFDRLVLVDVAKSILAFNREHLSYIVDISSSGSSAEQREKYLQKYEQYLDVFEKKSGYTYYWECDEKWKKIVQSLQEERIHVIRGNFASINANLRLINVLRELRTNITLDHSNLLQYVAETRTAYAKTVEALANVAHHNDLAILATTQHHRQCYRLWPFIIGSDPSLTQEQSDLIQWVYYYYPVGRAYLHAIDPSYYDAARIGEIELEDWQIDSVATRLHSLLIENAQKGDEWLERQADRFLRGIEYADHLTWTPAICIGRASTAKVWERVLVKTTARFSLSPQTGDGTDPKALVMKYLAAYRKELASPLEEFLANSQSRAQQFFKDVFNRRGF